MININFACLLHPSSTLSIFVWFNCVLWTVNLQRSVIDELGQKYIYNW